MAQVPQEKLIELRAIIDATPTNEKYAYIKTKLTEHFADSQQRRLQKVLSDMPLGDTKPSQLFNEMKRVAGKSLHETVLLDLWASRLPPHAQAAVIASRGDAADKTAIADAIVDSMGLRGINAVATAGVVNGLPAPAAIMEPPAPNAIEAIQREIAQLSRKLENMFLDQRRSRDRSQSRSRNRSNSRRDIESAIGPCWYHRTFGGDARRCRKPCSYGQQSSAGTSKQQ